MSIVISGFQHIDGQTVNQAAADEAHSAFELGRKTIVDAFRQMEQAVNGENIRYENAMILLSGAVDALRNVPGAEGGLAIIRQAMNL